jgi:16S rRNA (guanine527-N7)-methyltransferase
MPEIFPSFSVSRETERLLRDFEQQILKWTRSINLISQSTTQEVWTRHIIDSLQLMDIVPPEPRTWLDLGSGGGLPGIVVGIVARERWPMTRLTLVESDTRKAAFLKLMLKRYDLQGDVRQERAEHLGQFDASVLSARAFAPLDGLIQLGQVLMAPDGVGVFPKGRSFRDEIDKARERWRFKLVEKTSIIDPDSRILVVSEIEPEKGRT